MAFDFPAIGLCLAEFFSVRGSSLDRGTGLSDRVSELPSLEQRMDDVRAVMDAADSQRAALFGASEGGVMCALFAATYPDRTAALVLYGSYAKGTATADRAMPPSSRP